VELPQASGAKRSEPRKNDLDEERSGADSKISRWLKKRKNGYSFPLLVVPSFSE